jgi:hypothetical protein
MTSAWNYLHHLNIIIVNLLHAELVDGMFSICTFNDVLVLSKENINKNIYDNVSNIQK